MRRAAALLLLLLAASLPARALIQPRLLDWQARLAHILPRTVQARALETASDLPVTAMPEDLRAALGSSPGIPPEAVELFAGIRLLQRRDQVLGRFDGRVDLLERCAELLREYVAQAHYSLRNAREGPDGGPPLPEPGAGLPEPRVDKDTLTVLRPLPLPTPALPAGRLRTLLAAAEADRAEVESRLERARTAREAFRETTLVWQWHLRHLAEHLDPSTGQPLPPEPPALHQCPHPPVEAIPPPPPVDLPQMMEPPEPGS